MFEKVNPFHPDKLADRIAGAIVDYAYTLEDNPKVAVEVLVGHGLCSIIVESSVIIPFKVIKSITKRILGVNVEINYRLVPQDKHLADNQANGIACGDNGIFKGMPITQEQQQLADFASMFETDGKYIINGDTLICCQSYYENAPFWFGKIIFNPLGYWTGGIEVDSGATNRKLGSDMGDAVTGGGLCGKDCSKADVSVNIYAHLKAQELGKPVKLFCAIGDKTVDGRPYEEIVEIAKNYINSVGGFEKFAEWGLIRPNESIYPIKL